MANLIALTTARIVRLPESFHRAVVYVSDQAHHSVLKAAILAGFPARNVRAIPTDERCRMKIGLLEKAIAEDRRAGQVPFGLVGSAGTTNTGAVDDLAGLARIARREELWFHVDAAYGGFFALTERGREVLRGVGEADSIAIDPHKGLFLPYGNGALLVRDVSLLRKAHHSHAEYLPDAPESAGLLNFADLSPELSRDFRGLRVWLPIKMHGVGVFRRYLDEKLDLARWASAELRRIPGIEVLDEPQLSIVPFRLAPGGTGAEELDRINRELLERINRTRRVFLSGTLLRGRFLLRLCILHFRTHRDRVEEAVDIVRRAAGEVLDGRRGRVPE
jgi:aromatic-L-amino-acid decarboxylase